MGWRGRRGFFGEAVVGVGRIESTRVLGGILVGSWFTFLFFGFGRRLERGRGTRGKGGSFGEKGGYEIGGLFYVERIKFFFFKYMVLMDGC